MGPVRSLSPCSSSATQRGSACSRSSWKLVSSQRARSCLTDSSRTTAPFTDTRTYGERPERGRPTRPPSPGAGTGEPRPPARRCPLPHQGVGPSVARGAQLQAVQAGVPVALQHLGQVGPPHLQHQARLLGEQCRQRWGNRGGGRVTRVPPGMRRYNRGGGRGAAKGRVSAGKDQGWGEAWETTTKDVASGSRDISDGRGGDLTWLSGQGDGKGLRERGWGCSIFSQDMGSTGPTLQATQARVQTPGSSPSTPGAGTSTSIPQFPAKAISSRQVTRPPSLTSWPEQRRRSGGRRKTLSRLRAQT